jgi:mannose-1-phosphate guanylyltransferase
MLEEAVRRAQLLSAPEDVFIETSGSLKPLVESTGLLDSSQVLGEPLKRNTLGAVMWASAHLLAKGYEPHETSLAILTSDHRIAPPGDFKFTAEAALDLAEEQDLFVTIGIPPTRPETGFGYIETQEGSDHAVCFREKPDRETAERFIASGAFLWNSGMFFFRLSLLQNALREVAPELFEVLHSLAKAIESGEEGLALALFDTLPSTSFDYAVMERLSAFGCVRAGFEWDDLGTWASLERSLPADDHGNVCAGDVLVQDSENCIVYNDELGRVVALLGVQDLIVVSTHRAVLVLPKDSAQRVREIAKLIADREG